jgi:hypothetical protein
MNFEDFLNEKNFQVVTSMQAINYRLTYQYGKGNIVAMASSGKDLDKELASNSTKLGIAKDIEMTINMQLKRMRQNITVEHDAGYEGAGYSFTINFEDILKRLNKS